MKKTSVNLTKTAAVELTDALLIYRSTRGENSFVTRHKVANGQLGPAQPLSVDFLADLATSLGKGIETEILPVHVLVRTTDTIAWWTPETHRPMFFTGDRAAEFEDLNGRLFPQPPLVWMVRDGNLYVRALGANIRPTAASELLIAPYWNVSDNGLVCLGSMAIPNTRKASAIYEWEQSFFASQFSHPNTPKIVECESGYLPLMRDLAVPLYYDGPHWAHFHTAYLIPAKQTLGQFIAGGE